MTWEIVTGLVGGIGLFLLGMTLMTDGLKIAAGKALRKILQSSTHTRARALGSGFLITSLVQSSSAVTVATIGFVNAGLLKLSQSVWVIYGSNVGTTMTGWLVALLGFHIKIQLMALPAIGIGMFFKLFSNNERHAAYGFALTGFGVLFLGIDILKSTFIGLEHTIDLQMLAGTGLAHLLLFLVLGFIMTLLMQSSSAAMAITLTAAGSGLIPLEAAAAMVIGGNLGTTSTAVIAAVGVTSNAKRVAASHVIFNLVTGAVALLTLPVWLWLVREMSGLVEPASYTATLLALFHTIFNVLGVLLMWFFTAPMVAYLEKRFVADEEDESKTRYLDATMVNTPDLAHQALGLELARVADMVARMAKDAISTELGQSRRLHKDHQIVIRLVEHIAKFINQVQKVEIPEYLSPKFTIALAAARYFMEVADLAKQIDAAQSEEPHKLTKELHEAINVFRKLSVSALDIEDYDVFHSEAGLAEQRTAEIDKEYERLKNHLLHQGSLGNVPVRQVVGHIELLKNTERLVCEMLKGVVTLTEYSQLPESDTEYEKPELENILDEKD